MSVGSVVGGLGTSVASMIVDDFTKFQTFEPVACVWLVFAALNDLAISAILVWYLVSVSSVGVSYVTKRLQRNHRTGMSVTTDKMISRIIRSSC